MERYIIGTSRTSEIKNRFFNISVLPFRRSSFPSLYSPIPYPKAVTAAKISSFVTIFSSYSTLRLSPSRETSAFFTPFSFFVTRSTPAEHAEQLIPVTVNLSFVICRYLLFVFFPFCFVPLPILALSLRTRRRNALFSQFARIILPSW